MQWGIEKQRDLILSFKYIGYSASSLYRQTQSFSTGSLWRFKAWRIASIGNRQSMIQWKWCDGNNKTHYAVTPSSGWRKWGGMRISSKKPSDTGSRSREKIAPEKGAQLVSNQQIIGNSNNRLPLSPSLLQLTIWPTMTSFTKGRNTNNRNVAECRVYWNYRKWQHIEGIAHAYEQTKKACFCHEVTFNMCWPVRRINVSITDGTKFVKAYTQPTVRNNLMKYQT